MSYKLFTSATFDKEFKSLCKKHKSAKEDITSFVRTLKENPHQGVPLGNNCYKIRISIKSKGKGKSGGARLITYVCILDKELYLLSIYDKSERETILDKELKAILANL